MTSDIRLWWLRSSCAPLWSSHRALRPLKTRSSRELAHHYFAEAIELADALPLMLTGQRGEATLPRIDAGGERWWRTRSTHGNGRHRRELDVTLSCTNAHPTGLHADSSIRTMAAGSARDQTLSVFHPRAEVEMRRSRQLAMLSGGLAAGVALAAGASALSVDYFTVSTADPDFGTQCCSFPTSMVTGALGPNGLPVLDPTYNTSSGFTISDLTTANQITWWSPALNGNVTASGTGTVTLPFSSTTMFPPNANPAGNDATSFLTAKFTGTFNLATPSSVAFTLGSDDDSFLYVDGQLVVQNGGVHADSPAPVTTSLLGAGDHALTVFYADRYPSAAALDFSLDSTGVVIDPAAVPEPSTWAAVLGGLALLGAMTGRRARA